LADIFCVNESEAEIYTNCVKKIDCIESANEVLSLLLKQGCKIVIITLGPLGAVFASKDEQIPQWVQVPKLENPTDTSVSNLNKIQFFRLSNFIEIFFVFCFRVPGMHFWDL